MSEAIGGYFGLELQSGGEYHMGLTALNTGRNAFEYILRARSYRHVYIPYYTCDVLLEPLLKLNITYDFYSIDEMLEPISLGVIKNNSALLYTNYFGLKTAYIKKIAAKFPNLIIDASQAFFDKPLPGVDTFYSPRKFFGVPDGGYVSCQSSLSDYFEEDHSVDRFCHLITRVDKNADDGYPDFKRSELSLCNQPIKKISKLSHALLNNVNYQSCSLKRNENFRYLHSRLKSFNGIGWLDDTLINGPMCYPFYCNDNELRKKLIANQIYVTKYWPNVCEWVDEDSIEYRFYEYLIPLPIDQRYGEKELNKIIKIILG